MADMEKKFTKVGQLKVGGYVLIDDVCCQIKSTEKSKPGKHGSAKARITAVDIFTGQKKNLLKPTSADAEVPIVERGTAQVSAIMGDTIQVIDTSNYMPIEIKKPKEVGKLVAGDEIEFIRFGEHLKVVRKKWISN